MAFTLLERLKQYDTCQFAALAKLFVKIPAAQASV